MIHYLTELAVVHVGVCLGYWLFLRNEQQYGLMRAYLMGAAVLAVTIPLLKLAQLFSFSHEPLVMSPLKATPMDAMSIGAASSDAASIAPSAENPVFYADVLIGIYIVISAFFLVRFLSGVVYLIGLKRRSRSETVNGLTIRRPRNIQESFTFFNWIFLGEDIDPLQRDFQVILKHEHAHVSLGHTYDLIFLGLFKVFFWWLPTAWMVLKEIKKIHEYQADAVVIQTCNVDRYSSMLISATLATNGLKLRTTSPWQAGLPAVKGPSPWQAGLTSSFNNGLILKRLQAMKQKKKNVNSWKLATLTVLCASLVIALACSEERSIDQPKEQTFTAAEAYPEFEGGAEAFYTYIIKEISYPLRARKAGVEGRVDVQFVVDKDGSISNVQAIRVIGQGCDEEAVRVVRSAARFKPGTQNGKPVRVRMVVPIIFQLKADKTNPDGTKQGMIVVERIEYRYYSLRLEANYASGEWSGKVLDEDYNRLPGASIIVPGTTSGTISAGDGSFSLKAEEGNGIAVSFVGYGTMAPMRVFDPPENWQAIMDYASKDTATIYREHLH